MSHRGEAPGMGSKHFLKVYVCARKTVCVCMCASICECVLSVSVHVQACVCLCVVLGVTGGRYAMSWLTRVLLCCSVLLG